MDEKVVAIACNINKPCKIFSNILINKMVDENKKIDLDKVVSFNNEKGIFIYSLEILIQIILLKTNYI